MTFSLNNNVTWKSQSSGFSKVKTGTVVAIIPANVYVRKGQYPGMGIPGLPRDHESYIIKVGSKHYWPRVANLSLSA